MTVSLNYPTRPQLQNFLLESRTDPETQVCIKENDGTIHRSRYFVLSPYRLSDSDYDVLLFCPVIKVLRRISILPSEKIAEVFMEAMSKASNSLLHKLLDDAFGRILSYLPRSVMQDVKVCRSFKERLENGKPTLTATAVLEQLASKNEYYPSRKGYMNLFTWKRFSALGFSSFPQFDCLHLNDVGARIWPPSGMLDFPLTYIHDPSLPEILPQFPNLAVLFCDKHNASDVACAHIGKFLPKLEELQFAEHKKISDIGLESLKQLSSLINLRLGRAESHSQITDTGLSHVAAIGSLKDFAIWGCEGITDQGLSALRTLPRLTSLLLVRCQNITDTGIGYILEMRSLKELTIGSPYCMLTEAGIAQLKDHPSLEKVSVTSSLIDPEAITRLRALGIPIKGRD